MRKTLLALALALPLAGCVWSTDGTGTDTEKWEQVMLDIQAGLVQGCGFLASVDSVKQMIAASGGPTGVVVLAVVDSVCQAVTQKAAPSDEPGKKTVTVIINGQEVEVEGKFVESK